MKIERLYTRQVMTTTRTAPIAEAASAMRRFGVGTLLVVDENRARLPVGIVTDRDLAIQGFASDTSTVEGAMTPVLATVARDADTHEALEIMRANVVRRLLVTAPDGRICGILSIDDIVDGLAADLAAAAAVLKGEVKRDAAGVGEVKVGG